MPFREAARLATQPSATGSVLVWKTIGTVEVAFMAARTEGAPPSLTITLTPRATSSVANAGRRSYSPAAQRYSIRTFCPST